MVLVQKLIEIFMMETILSDSKDFDKQEVLKNMMISAKKSIKKITL